LKRRMLGNLVWIDTTLVCESDDWLD
jgi:hypothetical protein